MKIVFVFALLLGGVALLIWAGHAQRARRVRFIDEYAYPKSIRERVRKRYPHLTDEQLDRVMRGLTEWFHLHREAGRVTLSMPSQVVDAAWHEFILFTAGYRQFCSRALGRFLNHTPAEAMRSPTTAQDGLRRTWRRACAPPRAPLPWRTAAAPSSSGRPASARRARRGWRRAAKGRPSRTRARPRP